MIFSLRTMNTTAKSLPFIEGMFCMMTGQFIYNTNQLAGFYVMQVFTERYF